MAVFVEHPVYDARTLRLATDAVMTVADEEQQKLAAEVAALVATIFRAHKENNRLRATIERVRNALDGIALWVEVNGYPNTADVLEDIRTALEGESNV